MSAICLSVSNSYLHIIQSFCVPFDSLLKPELKNYAATVAQWEEVGILGLPKIRVIINTVSIVVLLVAISNV